MLIVLSYDSSSAMRPTQISSIDSKSRVASTNTAAQATSLLQSSTASNSAYFSRLGSNVSVSKQSVDSAVSRSKTPTRQNDVIEARSKRAAEWLHNEKKQVKPSYFDIVLFYVAYSHNHKGRSQETREGEKPRVGQVDRYAATRLISN